MVRLVKTILVYEDDKGQFETNMELMFMRVRPGHNREYWFKDEHGNEIILDESQHYENGENYVKWYENQPK